MKLKRLVSAVLAVGMALTMLPTAAFAANTTKYVTNLEFNGDIPKLPDDYIKNTDYVSQNNNWSWTGSGSSFKLNFDGVFDPSDSTHNVPNDIPCEVRNRKSSTSNGIIKGGTFANWVYNFNVIEGGIFDKIDNRGGSISNSIIRQFKAINSANENATITNSIIWGSFTNDLTVNNPAPSKIVSGLFCSEPSSASSVEYQLLDAKGCTIVPVLDGSALSGLQLPDDAFFTEKVYIVGDNQPNTFIVTSASKHFTWDKSNLNGATCEPYGTDGKSIKITLPSDGSNVEISAVAEKTPLIVGVGSNGQLRPVDEDGDNYDGIPSIDGWHFTTDPKTNISTLTITEDGVITLGNNEVDWVIDNYGTIEGGVFSCADPEKDVLTNEVTGVIKGGTYNVDVKNLGTIDDGAFTQMVNNYGEVNGGAFAGLYFNKPTKENQSDGTSATVKDGKTNGGIFSRYANFDTQDVKLNWVTLNNCTANGISGMVGVVGNQTLKIEADATSWTGWEVTADPAYEDAINKQVGNTSSFDLTLNGDDEWSVTLTAQVKEGYYRMNLTDGTATNADGTEITSAKAGDTVKLTAADAPDGMVFDRWEITPSDVALTLEEAGFDSHAATASFKMPAQTLNIRAMYRMADQPEEPNVLGTVAMVATAGVGAAVVGYTGYMIGTELYLNTVLPEGTAIPNNTTELAKLLWTDAGQPAPAAVLAADATDEQKALTWAVENQLISADKAADASVGRWEVIDAWNKAQEMKKA